MIRASCKNENEKKEIMLNKKKLWGTEFYIDNDYTFE